MNYRFHLQKYKKGNKGTCPNCHRNNCFVRYVDELGIIKFSQDIGRCDHEGSCSYHRTPKDFFHANPQLKSELIDYVNEPILYKEIPTSYIDDNIVNRSLGHYSINPLYLYFSKIFGKEEAINLFTLYRIGTASMWNGSTIFWLTDIEGKTRTGKVMDYCSDTGRRIKIPHNRINWVHSILKIPNFNLKQCFFGEHLLIHSTNPIAIVESEKTAMIAAHYLPEYTWLATGGIHGCLNHEAIKVLKGKRILLVPDLKAYETWKEKEQMFIHYGCKVKTFEFLERNANNEQFDSGLDLGDFLLQEKTSHQLLYEFIQKNSLLLKLIEKLNLQIM